MDKTLKEVWRWKEEVYQETKDMTREEVIAYFNGGLRRIQEETGIKLDLPRAKRREPARAPRTRPT